jgi:hypothetical protein
VAVQVLDRLKAASAFVQLVQTMSKPTKTAEGKIARAAGKLGKTSPLTTLQAQLQAAVEAAEQHSSSFKAKQAVSRLEKAAKEEQAAQAKVGSCFLSALLNSVCLPVTSRVSGFSGPESVSLGLWPHAMLTVCAWAAVAEGGFITTHAAGPASCWCDAHAACASVACQCTAHV